MGVPHTTGMPPPGSPSPVHSRVGAAAAEHAAAAAPAGIAAVAGLAHGRIVQPSRRQHGRAEAIHARGRRAARAPVKAAARREVVVVRPAASQRRRRHRVSVPRPAAQHRGDPGSPSMGTAPSAAAMAAHGGPAALARWRIASMLPPRRRPRGWDRWPRAAAPCGAEPGGGAWWHDGRAERGRRDRAGVATAACGYGRRMVLALAAVIGRQIAPASALWAKFTVLRHGARQSASMRAHQQVMRSARVTQRVCRVDRKLAIGRGWRDADPLACRDRRPRGPALRLRLRKLPRRRDRPQHAQRWTCRWMSCCAVMPGATATGGAGP
jgi:hypothetical protein